MVRPNRVKTVNFSPNDLVSTVGTAGSGFDLHYGPVNGMLTAIQVKENNFTATGSLILSVSGTGETIWSLVSGADARNCAESGVYLPFAHGRTTENLSLSGIGGDGVWTQFPIYGDVRLVGSNTIGSGFGINLVYV